jgi:peptide deformylase
MRLHLYPDPVLLKTAQPVTVFDDELRAGIAEMFDIMYGSNGVGLAGPQAGWLAQVLVLNPSASRQDEEEAMTVVNPKILKKWGKVVDQEGCLSFPEIYVDVERARGIRLAWQDGHGEHYEQDIEDFPVRIIQHDMDHLDGVLLVHRMSPVDRIRYRRALEDLAAATP